MKLLSKIGQPFFQLFIFLFTAIVFVVLFLERLLLTLDNLLTSLLYQPRPKKVKKKPIRIFFSPRVIITILLIVGWVYYLYVQIFLGLPSPYQLRERSQKLTTQMLDRNGKLLFKIYQDENRTPISLSSLPPYVKEAFLAIEDNGFYHHSGFSISSVIRATYHNLVKQKTEGGSTITQQLVKNALLTNEKTWQRKIKELILAIEVESVYDKDQILEMYLNEVGFGGTAYGIQEAANQYFGIDARDFSLPQAAFLAGLPKAPRQYKARIHLAQDSNQRPPLRHVRPRSSG